MARLILQLAVPNKPTSAREDYLKAVFQLAEGGRRVHTAELADRLGVSKPSVSAMVKRLAQEQLVDLSPRQGVRLTSDGRDLTMRVLRRHRLLETFLVRVLDLDWSEVHDEAEVLEHHLSDRLVDAIDKVLGYPADDPHGHPIPDADGNLLERDLAPLGELRTGESGTVRELRSDAAERLQRWKELGLVPGALVAMGERHEMEDVMHIHIGDETIVTGSEGVTEVFVEKRP